MVKHGHPRLHFMGKELLAVDIEDANDCFAIDLDGKGTASSKGSMHQYQSLFESDVQVVGFLPWHSRVVVFK